MEKYVLRTLFIIKERGFVGYCECAQLWRREGGKNAENGNGKEK